MVNLDVITKFILNKQSQRFSLLKHIEDLINLITNTKLYFKSYLIPVILFRNPVIFNNIILLLYCIQIYKYIIQYVTYSSDSTL